MKLVTLIIAAAVIVPCAIASYWLLREHSYMGGFFIAHFLMWGLAVGLAVWISFSGRRKRRSKDAPPRH
jgi:hypothetical protein